MERGGGANDCFPFNYLPNCFHSLRCFATDGVDLAFHWEYRWPRGKYCFYILWFI